MSGLLISIGLLMFALLGAPLFAVILASALIGFYQADTDLSVVAIEIYRLAEMPVLIAIPLFTFAGFLLGESKTPKRMVRLSNALLGWLPGGLAIVALVTCALFTAFTGASGVTIIALGALLLPTLGRAGYPEQFNLGLVTTSGSLGILFAPSLPIILYGVVVQQLSLDQPISIDDLFIAGLLPGMLMLFMLSIYSVWVAKNNQQSSANLLLDNHESKTKNNKQQHKAKEVLLAIKDSAWELPLPLVVLGGIYSGFLVVSEAAAITALYVLVVEVFIRREITWHGLNSIIRESMLLVGGVMIIIGASLASTNYLIDAEVPTKLFELIQSAIQSKFLFLIILTAFLLILGMMLDIFSALVIVVPIILPIAIQYGIHPIHLGILFLANMQLGYFTPPVGMNLFIASYRFDKPVLSIYSATIPFFIILLICVLMITFIPALSLGLLPE